MTQEPQSNLDVLKEISATNPPLITMSDMGFVIGTLPSIIEIVEAAQDAHKRMGSLGLDRERLTKALEAWT